MGSLQGDQVEVHDILMLGSLFFLFRRESWAYVGASHALCEVDIFAIIFCNLIRELGFWIVSREL